MTTASARQRIAAAVGIAIALFMLVGASGPTRKQPHFVCDNNGLVVIAGSHTDNVPADIAAKYCSGDIKAAASAIESRYGKVINQWAFIHLPSSS